LTYVSLRYNQIGSKGTSYLYKKLQNKKVIRDIEQTRFSSNFYSDIEKHRF